MNEFKKDMVDELYRSKLRRDQKFEHMKIADSMPKSNLIILFVIFCFTH